MMIVNYNKYEAQELEDLLKANGFKISGLKEHCFPICVDIENLNVLFTSTFMLRDIKEKNLKMISVKELKKYFENN